MLASEAREKLKRFGATQTVKSYVDRIISEMVSAVSDGYWSITTQVLNGQPYPVVEAVKKRLIEMGYAVEYVSDQREGTSWHRVTVPQEGHASEAGAACR